MMNKFVPLTLAALTCVGMLSTPAFAQYGVNINVNQAALQQRINAGVRTGLLTRNEAQNLRTKMARLNYLEARLRNSGRGLSFSERARLNRELSQLNVQINRQLADSQTRYNRNHRVGVFGRYR
jgi:hypothetical protein